MSGLRGPLYGTPEWIAYIQKNYLLWPKQDRRRSDRRQQDRRNISFERRNRDSQRRLYRSQQKNIQDILTDEEKQLLMQVMQYDDKELGK